MGQPFSRYGQPMTIPNLKILRSESTRCAVRDAIALMARVGLNLAEWQQKLYPEGFEVVCSKTFRVSLARAELLIRHANARPTWADPSAVDLADPLASELFAAGLLHGRALSEEASS